MNAKLYCKVLIFLDSFSRIFDDLLEKLHFREMFDSLLENYAIFFTNISFTRKTICLIVLHISYM